MRLASKSEFPGVLSRVGRFLQKPWREKIASLRYRWHAATASIPVPVRLPFGAWWLLRNDHLGGPIRAGEFETAELAFAGRFLQSGMTVLDIGAHHGLYTLLASRSVGPSGRVFSFEPSPRERRALRLHLALNFCWNVKVQGLALGSEETQADLFVVQGSQTGCNSLRPPIVISETAPVRVEVLRLDDWLEAHRIDRVDFIKLDVEGGELEVLKGVEKLLERQPRPVILAEVQDLRTGPWGYRAKEIIEYLIHRGYKWFSITIEGYLEELDINAAEFDGNFVATPLEHEVELQVATNGISQVEEPSKHGSRGAA
jgi:FkbM family methyltransferase